jgi:DNA invertase Pin-like site-specific DNA recombinase
LLIEAFDRLSRQDAVSAFLLLLQIVRSGIRLVTTKDCLVFRDGDMTLEKLMLSLVSMSTANTESVRKAGISKDNWAEKRRNAADEKLTAKCPAWLVLNEDRKSFTVLEARAEIVRRIFGESASGFGHFLLSKRLNHAGIRPFGKSTAWATSSVKRILSNRAVIGTISRTVPQGGREPEGRRDWTISRTPLLSMNPPGSSPTLHARRPVAHVLTPRFEA